MHLKPFDAVQHARYRVMVTYALEKVRRRFSDSRRNRPYRRRDLSVHLSYGEELEFRILLPPLN
jgi:hypothetical protein